MKRKALAIILITVIALSIAAWVIYNQVSVLQSQISELQAQNDELQEQNSNITEYLQNIDYNANITNISLEENWTYVNPLYRKYINFTIQNIGPYDIGGLTLIYNITGNQTVKHRFVWLEPTQMGILRVGESKLIQIALIVSTDELPKLSGQALIASLMLDGYVLHEKTMVIPQQNE